MRDGLLVGELSAKTGVSRKALRLYELRGILPPPGRTASGYRVYPTDTLRLLAFVSRARRLGLTLGDIAQIVALRRAGTAPCVHIRSLLERKAADLEGVLGELRGILSGWRNRSGPAVICPHLEAKGGDFAWTRSQSRSVRRAPHVRRSSSKKTGSASARPRTW